VPQSVARNDRYAGLSSTFPSLLLTRRIITAGWQHRQRLLSFCTSTVERDLQEKQRLIQGQEPGLDRRPVASLFEEQVLVIPVSDPALPLLNLFLTYRLISSRRRRRSNPSCGNVRSRVSRSCRITCVSLVDILSAFDSLQEPVQVLRSARGRRRENMVGCGESGKMMVQIRSCCIDLY
jgi:hypothetical protein